MLYVDNCAAHCLSAGRVDRSERSTPVTKDACLVRPTHPETEAHLRSHARLTLVQLLSSFVKFLALLLPLPQPQLYLTTAN